MIKDFQTKENRLKKQSNYDFKLADSDDFFGFSKSERMTISDILVHTAIAIVGLILGWFIISAFLSLTPNI